MNSSRFVSLFLWGAEGTGRDRWITTAGEREWWFCGCSFLASVRGQMRTVRAEGWGLKVATLPVCLFPTNGHPLWCSHSFPLHHILRIMAWATRCDQKVQRLFLCIQQGRAIPFISQYSALRHTINVGTCVTRVLSPLVGAYLRFHHAPQNLSKHHILSNSGNLQQSVSELFVSHRPTLKLRLTCLPGHWNKLKAVRS